MKTEVDKAIIRQIDPSLCLNTVELMGMNRIGIGWKYRYSFMKEEVDKLMGMNRIGIDWKYRYSFTKKEVDKLFTAPTTSKLLTMARRQAQDESNNGSPVIAPETGVPANSPPVENGPSEQSSALVGLQAPKRSAVGKSDFEAKEGDSQATISAAPPGVSPPVSDCFDAPTRSADGNLDLEAMNGDLSKFIKPEPLGPSSDPVDAALGLADVHVASAELVKRSRGKGDQGKTTTAQKPQTPTPPPQTLSPKEKFLESLRGLQPGKKEFLKEFLLGEAKYFNNSEVEVNIHENGEDFMREVKYLIVLHLVRNSNGLGMKAPEGFCREKVLDYVSRDEVIGINYSSNDVGKQLDNMTIGVLLDKFGIPEELREDFINSIAFEFSNTDLGQEFQEPKFVENGIVQKLNKILQELPMSKDVRKSIEMMPKYTKFLIISMAGSFTDVHFDFSGTSVFYHVFEGQKVFYVAPQTEENLEKFMNYQKKAKEQEDWIGITLADQWQRIVINPGETAFIPGGHLHFVYTPVDSLVIGGNYIMEKDIELGFKCTKHEEDLLTYPKKPTPKNDDLNRSGLFQGFRSTMWAYVEHILLPKLKESQDDESIALARFFVSEADPRKKHWPLGLKEWYSEEKRTDLLKELRKILRNFAAAKKKRENQTNVEKDEEEELPGTSEKASTSASLDLKRRQKTPRKKTMKNDKEESLEDTKETGSQDTAQPESSSTSLPSAAPVSRISKRKRSAPPRTANPSTSAAAKPRRKMNKMMDPMEDDQEELETTSQKPSTSSCPAPAPITRGKKRGKTPTHSNTAASTSAVRQQPKKTSIKNPNPQTDDDDEKMEGLEDSQPQSEVALDMDKKESSPVEKQMNITSHSAPACTPKKMKTPSDSSISALTSTSTRQNRGDPSTTPDLDKKEPRPAEKETEETQKENTKVFQDERELNHSVSSARVPYYSNEDDYDTVSHGQQPMDTEPVDNRMEVDGEDNDEIPRREKESTPVHPFTSSGVSSLASKNEGDADSRPLEKPVPLTDPVLLADVDSSKNANEKDQPTLAATDSEKMESIPAEDEGKVDQEKKNESLDEVKEIVPEHEPTLPPCSGITPSKTFALNRRSVPQQNKIEVMKTSESEKEKQSLTVLDPIVKEPEPNNGQIEQVQQVQKEILEEPNNGPIKKVQEIQEKIVKVQESIPNDEIVQPVSSSVMESASQRHSATQTDLVNVSNVQNIEEDDLSSAIPDSEKKKPELIKKPLEKVPNVRGILEEPERTPLNNSTNPVPSSNTTSNSKNTNVGFAFCYPTPQENDSDALKVSVIGKDKQSPSDSNLKTTDSESAEDSIKEVQNFQEDMPESQEFQITPSNEKIWSSSSPSKVPEKLAAAVKTPSNLPPVSASDHLAQKQSMSTSPEVLPRKNISGIEHPARTEKDQVENEEQPANLSQVELEEEEEVADPANGVEDGEAKLEEMASSSFLQNYQLVNQIDSLPDEKRRAAFEAMASQMALARRVVELEAHAASMEDVAAMEVDDTGNTNSSRDADLRQNALYHHSIIIEEINALPYAQHASLYNSLSRHMAVVQKLLAISQAGVEKEKAVTDPGNEKMASFSLLQGFKLLSSINTLPMNQQLNAYNTLALYMTAVQPIIQQIHQMTGMKAVHQRNEIGTSKSSRDHQLSATSTTASSADLRQTAMYQHILLIDEIIALPTTYQTFVHNTMSSNMTAVKEFVAMVKAQGGPTTEAGPSNMAASQPSKGKKRTADEPPSGEPVTKKTM